ncbi:hypothetical protein OROHE_026783 [Orobanche hederae]
MPKPLFTIPQDNLNFLKTHTNMVSTPLTCKILSHTRSSSLPSRSHPLIPQFDDRLRTLNKSDNDLTSSSSLSSIAKKLHSLENVHNSIDDLLLLPHTHQVFARERREKWVEEITDGYLSLVDACATAKDFVSNSKGYVASLLSVLRRRRDTDDLSEFISSRKTTKKMIQKSLRDITSLKNKSSVLALDKDHETIAVISMLKEAESTTLELIEALLVSVAGGAKSHSSGWCLVARLIIRSRKTSGGQDQDNISHSTPEFGDLDATLSKIVSFRTSKSGSVVQIDDVQQQLKDMDGTIQVVEERLECLFKRLIKSRVSLLNMQSQF